MQRVIAPHGALQLREFADHLRHQIGFGKHSSTFGARLVCANQQSNFTGELAYPRDTLTQRAQFVVINNLGKFGDARVEPCLFIGLKEKPRIGQPRTHYALVALNDLLRISQLHVGDNQELIFQLSCAVEQREIFLIGLHGQNQALLRYRKKFCFELADVNGGPFNQRRDLIEQIGIAT